MMHVEQCLEQTVKQSVRRNWIGDSLRFLLVSLAICSVVFKAGLWGGSLLAPVDLAPTLFGHYKFVDPASGRIPANHFIIDQLGYDLPLQWTIYHAVRRGEIPWWDPFDSGGRPFLADAHISAADPIRVACYLCLPRFELAYNWTRILHFLASSLGLFVLLRRLGYSGFIAGALALAGGFSGATINYFGHPWIQASFLYYPWIWIAWDESWVNPSRRWPRIVAPLLAAAVFYAGNLQSHSYLPIFAVSWMVALSGRSWLCWKKALRIVIPTGLLGAMLAAPVLLPELELFSLNHRSLSNNDGWSIFDGPLSLMNFYPWALGSFRTVGYHNLSYVAYIGTAALALALIGTFSRADRPAVIRAKRVAIGLVLSYAAIIGTPAAHLLYARTSGLAIPGLVVLAAIGLEAVLRSPVRWPKCGWTAIVAAVSIAALSHAFAWFVYPQLLGRVSAAMNAHAKAGNYGGADEELRHFQVRNFPHEITFANPETLAAWASLALLAAVLLSPRLRSRRLVLGCLVALNLLPLLLFAHRFIPRAPIETWHRLLDGSEEQRHVVQILSQGHFRLLDDAPAEFERLFPQNLSHLYAVHSAHGYAALQPNWLANFPTSTPATLADYAYASEPPWDSGSLIRLNTFGNARFSWARGDTRHITVRSESLNSLDLEFPPGPPSSLLRTDTWFPGWTVELADGTALPINRTPVYCSEIQIPAGVTALHFRYRPSHLAGAIAAAGLACLALAFAAFRNSRAMISLPVGAPRDAEINVPVSTSL